MLIPNIGPHLYHIPPDSYREGYIERSLDVEAELFSEVKPRLRVAYVHNKFGYLPGYRSGRLFRLPERDCRTIAIEVGMQNGGLTYVIANKISKVATASLADAVFAPLMTITGSALASW